MDSAKVLYSEGKNDECYTPRYVVEAILPYLRKEWTYWCPFDKEDSNFVKVLREHGFAVVSSHIDEGLNFFEYEPIRWDAIISNPPFSGKKKIFERALSFGKPFALLMTMTWLNDSAPKDLFYDADLQLFLFRNRIKFLDKNGNQIDSKITFASGFYCHDFLPKQIIIYNEKLEKEKEYSVETVDFHDITRGDLLFHKNTGFELVQEISYDKDMRKCISFACSATLFKDTIDNFEYVLLTSEILKEMGFVRSIAFNDSHRFHLIISGIRNDYEFCYDSRMRLMSVFRIKNMNEYELAIDRIEIKYANELQRLFHMLKVDDSCIRKLAL